MDVQRRLKNLMAEKNWTEYRLAKEANLSQSTITNLFKRKNSPTLPTIEAICAAFNITLSQFFADQGEAVVLTKEQKAHLELWGTITDEQRHILNQLLKTMRI